MNYQQKLTQIIKYVLPSVLFTALLAVLVSWKFDNEADVGEQKDSLEEVFGDEFEGNLYKYGIVILGVFVLLSLISKNLKD